MKLKRIAQLCRQSGHITLYEGHSGVQWISDGYAAYPLFGLPPLKPDNIFTMFDITAKQSEKITIKTLGLPERLDFTDTDPNEVQINSFEIELSRAGRVLIPYRTSHGVFFMDGRYLTPLGDLKENLEIFERISKDGHTYFAAKSGLMLYAVIMPYDLISDNTVKTIKSLYYECKVALFNKKTRETGMYSFSAESPEESADLQGEPELFTFTVMDEADGDEEEPETPSASDGAGEEPCEPS